MASLRCIFYGIWNAYEKPGGYSMKQKRFDAKMEVTMTPAMHEAVKALAYERDMAVTQVVRTAIAEYVARAERGSEDRTNG
jgi:hypothetical protein